MRKIMFLTVLLCLVLLVMPAYADKKPKDVNIVNTIPVKTTGGAYRAAGVSNETFRGNEGVANLHQACRETLNNSEARMCTSKEIFETPDIISQIGQQMEGWVQPVIVAAFPDSSVLDFTGFRAGFPGQLSCDAWQDPLDNGRGLTLVTTLTLTRWNTVVCSEERPVICCAPK